MTKLWNLLGRLLVFIGLVGLINLSLSIQYTQKTTEHIDNIIEPEEGSNDQIDEFTYDGYWSKKLIFRPRWVKTWEEKKVYVAVWKRMWGPVQIKEWMPVPKLPPGWDKNGRGTFYVPLAP